MRGAKAYSEWRSMLARSKGPSDVIKHTAVPDSKFIFELVPTEPSSCAFIEFSCIVWQTFAVLQGTGPLRCKKPATAWISIHFPLHISLQQLKPPSLKNVIKGSNDPSQ